MSGDMPPPESMGHTSAAAGNSEFLMFLVYGSLGIVAWKCGDLLINEMKYRSEKAAKT